MAHYEVSVEYTFRASHAIPLPDGTMEPPHAHDWQVTATFRADALDPRTGVAVDFLDVDRALKTVCTELDATDLNALPALAGAAASAERIAEYLAGQLSSVGGTGARLFCVSVTEAPRCRATYYP